MRDIMNEIEMRDTLHYLDEMELSGSRTYWHGSLNPPPIDISENAMNIGGHKCFFFTTHFGYALSYIYHVKSQEDLAFYKEYPKMVKEIDASGVELTRTDKIGYLYPLSLKKHTNIYDSHGMGDLHYMMDRIGNDERISGLLHKSNVSIKDFCWKLAGKDWFDVRYEGSDIYVPGLKRDDLIELVRQSNDGVAFHGFSNKEFNEFHAIGLFKDRMKAHLGQGKPFKVVFDQSSSKIRIEYWL